MQEINSGFHLRITTVMNPATTFDSKVSINSNGDLELEPCFTFDLLKSLQYSMNFTYSLILATTYGEYNKSSSTWNGMVEHLLNGQADLALASEVDLPLKRQVVDYNIPTSSFRFLALYLKPDLHKHPLVHLKPFTTSLWLSIVAWLIGTAMALLIIHDVIEPPEGSQRKRGSIFYRMTPKYIRDVNEKLKASERMSLSDCIFAPLTMFCARGQHEIPPQRYYRVIFLMGEVVNVVLTTAYVCTLHTFLSLDLGGVQTFESLLRTSHTIVIDGNFHMQRMLELSVTPVIRNAYDRRAKGLNYNNIFEAKDDIMKGSLAFITYDLSAYYGLEFGYSHKEQCDIGEVQLPMPNRHTGTMMPKGSPYKQSINYEILKTKEYGLNDRWLRRYVPQRSKCSRSESAALSLRSAFVPMSVIGIGIVAAILVLIVELRHPFDD